MVNFEEEWRLLKDYKVAPSQELWDRIQSDLSVKRLRVKSFKNSFKMQILASALLVFMFGGAVMAYMNYHEQVVLDNYELLFSDQILDLSSGTFGWMELLD